MSVLWHTIIKESDIYRKYISNSWLINSYEWYSFQYTVSNKQKILLIHSIIFYSIHKKCHSDQ